MAKKTSSYTAPQSAQLTVEAMQQAIPRLKKRIAEVEAFEPGTVTADDPSAAIRPLRASIEDALVRTFGNDTVEYGRYRAAAVFDWPINMFNPTPLNVIRESVARSKSRSLDLLNSAVASLEEQIQELGGGGVVDSRPARPQASPGSRKVFIVHGHDDGPREAVARYLERLGFSIVILHEMPNQGRTIIEKFETHADVGFAIVMMTPDDVGGVSSETLQARARQNVILELGYFIGRLGRDRVCALKSGSLELPSDILGVVYTAFDPSGGWRVSLAKELQAAGFEIDWNKAMG